MGGKSGISGGDVRAIDLIKRADGSYLACELSGDEEI